MSEHRGDSLMDCLFSEHGKKLNIKTLRNIKFCRGDKDVISEAELRVQVHSALVQKATGAATMSRQAPRSKRPVIDVRKFVADNF